MMMKLPLPLLAGFFLFLPLGWAEDWEVVWKDSTQTLRIDRSSVRVNGKEVEYWYSDEVDALVDLMEHHFHAVTDCENHRMRLIEVYDPTSGQTQPVADSEWKDVAYDPSDSLAVMHDEVCLSYARR